jgi:hypothetical protein
VPSDLKILPHWPTSYLQEELAMREGILADTRRKLEAAGIFDADDFREIGADSADLSWCMHTHLQAQREIKALRKEIENRMRAN